MKKLIYTLSFLSLFLCNNLVAQENNYSLSFSNEVGSDVIIISDENAIFPGIVNETIAEFTSEKVDVGIDAVFELVTDEDGKPESISYTDFDWFLTFRPFASLSLNLHKDLFTTGSYLVVEDDNISSGNMGSDGFSVGFTGIPNLTLVSAIPLDSNSFSKTYLNEEGKEEDYYFNIGFGAEYLLFENLALGATVKNIFNTDFISFGFYVGFSPIENLSIFGGYSYNDEGFRSVLGDNIFNASVVYEKEKITLAADYVTSNDNYYSAVGFGFVMTDKVSLGINVTLDGVYNSDEALDGEKFLLGVNPNATFLINEKNEIGVETVFNFTDEGFADVSFPVYWNYSF